MWPNNKDDKRRYRRHHRGHRGAAGADDQVACVVFSNALRSCRVHSTSDSAYDVVPSRDGPCRNTAPALPCPASATAKSATTSIDQQMTASTSLKHSTEITTTTTQHPFNGLFSRTSWVIRYQKGTRSSAIAEAPRDASCQLKSCQLPRNSAETTYTTSPDQIDGMKLEI